MAFTLSLVLFFNINILYDNFLFNMECGLLGTGTTNYFFLSGDVDE